MNAIQRLGLGYLKVVWSKMESKINIIYTLSPILVLSAIVLSGFVVFCGRVLVLGMPRSPRIQQETQSIFLNKLFMEFWTWFIKPIVGFLVRLRVSPDAVTLAGTLVAAGAGVAFYFGAFGAGGWLVLAAGTIDMLDGTVARSLNRASKAGAFLDSTLDRYSELFIFAGLIHYYADSGFMAVVLLALIGSMMVSYARARAEGVGVDCKVGNMQRTERMLYIGIGTAFAPVVANLWETDLAHPQFFLAMIGITIVAIFSNTTAFRRMMHTYQTLRAQRKQSSVNVTKLAGTTVK